MKKENCTMKFILAMTDEWTGISFEKFSTKEDLLQYLNKNEWELIKTMDWNNVDKQFDTVVEYIAIQNDNLGRTKEAHLLVVKN